MSVFGLANVIVVTLKQWLGDSVVEPAKGAVGIQEANRFDGVKKPKKLDSGRICGMSGAVGCISASST